MTQLTTNGRWPSILTAGYRLVRRGLAEAIQLRNLTLHVLANGTGRVCPVCGHACTLFRTAGPNRRPDAECPNCGSRERHRFLWRYLQRNAGNIPAGALVLHVAPEPFLGKALQAQLSGCRYLSCDLISPSAMVHLDLTRLPIADRTVHLLLCSHVLEHIPDDTAAMQEIARVIAPSGVALIAVPMIEGATDEDLSITDPDERARRYGQEDHVRLYGDDIHERLTLAGLVVSRVNASDILTKDDRQNFGIPDWLEPIYVCRRPA